MIDRSAPFGIVVIQRGEEQCAIVWNVVAYGPSPSSLSDQSRSRSC